MKIEKIVNQVTVCKESNKYTCLEECRFNLFKIQLHAVYQRDTPKDKGMKWLKVNGWEKKCHVHTNQKKGGVDILIAAKIDKIK